MPHRFVWVDVGLIVDEDPDCRAIRLGSGELGGLELAVALGDDRGACFRRRVHAGDMDGVTVMPTATVATIHQQAQKACQRGFYQCETWIASPEASVRT
jgi:hypothetical protein